MKRLEFGTAGIRGTIGKGEGNLNYAHAQRIAHAYAKYLLNKYKNKEIKIVIGRDNRKKSYSFAVTFAQILYSYGIKVIFSRDICATPFVSFAIMYYEAQGGVNITASHNPKEYNGIKLYNDLAFQCLPEEIDEMLKYFEPYETYDENYNISKGFKLKDYPKAIFITKRIKKIYIDPVAKLAVSDIDKKIDNIKVVYSPLHGTGAKFVPEIFKNIFKTDKNGEISNVFYIKEQMKIDSNFSHCSLPNPEKTSAYDLLIKEGTKNKADILLMTDPDSDRVGLAVLHKNKYRLLNGNDTATIISKYLLDNYDFDHDKSYLVYSFVSSNIPEILANKKGIKSYVVPTGFKWIGMIIDEQRKLNNKCFYAFEESYGSLINEELSRDKDAFQSVSLLCKMASEYKKQGLTLVDLLDEIYQQVGYVASEVVDITVSQETNLEDLQTNFSNLKLDDKIIEDYNKKEGFMKANMIKIKFKNDNSWLALRPSGTEPKIKFYIFAFDKSPELAIVKLNNFKSMISQIIDNQNS
ncbi:phospho-sugar mutase [Mycoplasma tauri]|uniref:phospho-sugar mutase n=1 Tax=Mycoplasma tauri TaxID=547987 RepID=UPI001CBB7022|nr:phospho-sugar mutase [Mycoplasma tauri]MBZ4204247.1 phospho-sugar mutase [Mycoplasma tauri]